MKTASTQTEGYQWDGADRQIPIFSAKRFEDDAAGLHFYTGLGTYETFVGVLGTLVPKAHELIYYHGINPITLNRRSILRISHETSTTPHQF